MLPFTYLPCTRQPTAAWLCHTWPADALQRRRRAVLFAFTFSPPGALA
jgi:hypothetical protein